MKDLQYITHDMGARNDVKLLRLQMEMGGQGLGIFWCLVEMLWEAEGYLDADYEAIAFNLRWATPQEVEKVVKDFGLFQEDGKRFWSRSALERIGAKKEKIQTASERGRKAIEARWNRSRNTDVIQPYNASNTDVQQTLNGSSTGVIPRNKDIYKDRDIDREKAPLLAADIYDLFLFELNLKDPAGETERFLEHYRDKWTYADGTPIKDPLEAARKWHPEKAGKRFDSEALNWYRAVWNAARSRVENAHAIFVEALTRITRNGQSIAITFASKEAGYAVGNFVMDNDLAGDYKIDYRLES